MIRNSFVVCLFDFRFVFDFLLHFLSQVKILKLLWWLVVGQNFAFLDWQMS